MTRPDGDGPEPARRLLVVDDNPDDVFVVQIAAEDVSPAVQVDSADSGDQLLGWVEAGAEEPPTALLIDWHLPGTPAAEVIVRLRARPDWQHVPIVVCSGGGEATLADDARSLGADGFEPKPTSIDGVLAMIERVLALAAPVAAVAGATATATATAEETA